MFDVARRLNTNDRYISFLFRFFFRPSVIMMGKNTMMRKAIRGQVSKNVNLEKLLPHVFENIGFIFTKEDLSSIRDKILENKVKIDDVHACFAFNESNDI
jgi:ribosomal protein L10